jgi:hypothetical protein
LRLLRTDFLTNSFSRVTFPESRSRSRTQVSSSASRDGSWSGVPPAQLCGTGYFTEQLLNNRSFEILSEPSASHTWSFPLPFRRRWPCLGTQFFIAQSDGFTPKSLYQALKNFLY